MTDPFGKVASAKELAELVFLSNTMVSQPFEFNELTAEKYGQEFTKELRLLAKEWVTRNSPY